ncbi:MAG: glycosyltransferase [Anaerolineae bacterium]
MSRPHVLMLTPYLPYPPISGGRMRTYNLVRHLADEYAITLVSFGRPEERAFDTAPLEQFCDLVIVDRPSSPGLLQAAVMSLTSLRPITMRLYSSPAMRDTLARLCTERPFRVVHVESFYMMPNLPADLDVPVLLSEPAIEYLVWRRHAGVARPFYARPGIALEALKMRLWEPRIWRQAAAVGAMSEVDARLIHRHVPHTQVVLAPNAVDVAHFTPDPVGKRDQRTAIYMGDYKYFPNEDAVLYFAAEVLPLVRAQRPDFRLVLLGKDPTPALRALGDAPDSGVEIAGLVDDTRPYLRSCAMFVCPLRSGSGTRYKILEALACGAPVVSTSIGSEGLAARDGEHLLIADRPEDFAAAILRLLDDPTLAARLGQQGREWVAAHHAWEQSAALVSAAYRRLMGVQDKEGL